MTLEVLTSFFGWMSVINIAFLLISALMMLLLKDWATSLHARLFGIEASAARLVWYRWLGNYKILTLILSIVPYFALRLAA
jgi:hypothetical protein